MSSSSSTMADTTSNPNSGLERNPWTSGYHALDAGGHLHNMTSLTGLDGDDLLSDAGADFDAFSPPSFDPDILAGQFGASDNHILHHDTGSRVHIPYDDGSSLSVTGIAGMSSNASSNAPNERGFQPVGDPPSDEISPIRDMDLDMNTLANPDFRNDSFFRQDYHETPHMGLGTLLSSFSETNSQTGYYNNLPELVPGTGFPADQPYEHDLLSSSSTNAHMRIPNIEYLADQPYEHDPLFLGSTNVHTSIPDLEYLADQPYEQGSLLSGPTTDAYTGIPDFEFPADQPYEQDSLLLGSTTDAHMGIHDFKFPAEQNPLLLGSTTNAHMSIPDFEFPADQPYEQDSLLLGSTTDAHTGIPDFGFLADQPYEHGPLLSGRTTDAYTGIPDFELPADQPYEQDSLLLGSTTDAHTGIPDFGFLADQPYEHNVLLSDSTPDAHASIPGLEFLGDRPYEYDLLLPGSKPNAHTNISDLEFLADHNHEQDPLLLGTTDAHTNVSTASFKMNPYAGSIDILGQSATGANQESSTTSSSNLAAFIPSSSMESMHTGALYDWPLEEYSLSGYHGSPSRRISNMDFPADQPHEHVQFIPGPSSASSAIGTPFAGASSYTGFYDTPVEVFSEHSAELPANVPESPAPPSEDADTASMNASICARLGLGQLPRGDFYFTVDGHVATLNMEIPMDCVGKNIAVDDVRPSKEGMANYILVQDAESGLYWRARSDSDPNPVLGRTVTVKERLSPFSSVINDLELTDPRNSCNSDGIWRCCWDEMGWSLCHGKKGRYKGWPHLRDHYRTCHGPRKLDCEEPQCDWKGSADFADRSGFKNHLSQTHSWSAAKIKEVMHEFGDTYEVGDLRALPERYYDEYYE
ncbi:MAG: hypothetical protein M1812_004946 [Candelaria pacifica]|nr:MAG: hypothetical protein M1812_004946 [Candelaria pacifica]